MIDLGKRSVLGVMVDAVDYEAAVERVIRAAVDRRSYSATALAVHGVMTGADDDGHRYRLNHLDLVTPDGQPVRWALNLLHRTRLRDRVYGPTLTLKICEAASAHQLGVYFYGSREEVVRAVARRLSDRFPELAVCGAEPSKFRQINAHERQELLSRIRNSGAALTFVGLGCPLQEIFTYECSEDLRMPVVAVGAAFDYHAGLLREPPRWMQACGFQWAYRLAQDPKRLGRRYIVECPPFILDVLRQRLGRRILVSGAETEPADLLVA